MQALTKQSRQHNVLAFLQPTERLTAEQSLRIYQQSAEGGIYSTLAAIYPVCLRLVGQQCFAGLARAYWRQHPQRRANLHDYGRHLGQVIERSPLQASVPYLADVARLEWAIFYARQAPISQVLTLEALAQQSTEQQASTLLPLRPHHALLYSPYPVHAIWRANQHAQVPSVKLEDGPDYLLIQLDEDTVRVRALSEPQLYFLQLCDCGKNLAKISTLFVSCWPESLLPELLQELFALDVFYKSDN